jgi:hypothetical protein
VAILSGLRFAVINHSSTICVAKNDVGVWRHSLIVFPGAPNFVITDRVNRLGELVARANKVFGPPGQTIGTKHSMPECR